MTPMERLLAEAIPTRPAPPDSHTLWTPAEQARHRADLLNALDGWTYDRDRRQGRHLRLVDEPSTPTA